MADTRDHGYSIGHEVSEITHGSNGSGIHSHSSHHRHENRSTMDHSNSSAANGHGSGASHDQASVHSVNSQAWTTSYQPNIQFIAPLVSPSQYHPSQQSQQHSQSDGPNTGNNNGNGNNSGMMSSHDAQIQAMASIAAAAASASGPGNYGTQSSNSYPALSGAFSNPHFLALYQMNLAQQFAVSGIPIPASMMPAVSMQPLTPPPPSHGKAKGSKSKQKASKTSNEDDGKETATPGKKRGAKKRSAPDDDGDTSGNDLLVSSFSPNDVNDNDHDDEPKHKMQKKARGGPTSRFRGVSRCGRDRKWQARIRNLRELHYLGRYKTEIEAALIYDDAARRFHGDKATTNFIRMTAKEAEDLKQIVTDTANGDFGGQQVLKYVTDVGISISATPFISNLHELGEAYGDLGT